MADLAARLDRVVRTASVAIDGVSIRDPQNRATWTVAPISLQTQAQPTIDAFDPNDPVHEQAELDTAVRAALDQERLFSAIVWAVIDTLSPPATVTKYNAARTKIINAFKVRPWAP